MFAVLIRHHPYRHLASVQQACWDRGGSERWPNGHPASSRDLALAWREFVHGPCGAMGDDSAGAQQTLVVPIEHLPDALTLDLGYDGRYSLMMATSGVGGFANLSLAHLREWLLRWRPEGAGWTVRQGGSGYVEIRPSVRRPPGQGEDWLARVFSTRGRREERVGHMFDSSGASDWRFNLQNDEAVQAAFQQCLDGPPAPS